MQVACECCAIAMRLRDVATCTRTTIVWMTFSMSAHMLSSDAEQQYQGVRSVP
jgi:hypothetical protein